MSFHIAGKEIKLRDKVIDELNISILSNNMEISIPYTIITGKEKGPVLYIGAGSHGDEVTSIYTALKLAKELGPDDVKKGAIVVVPIHNPLAVLYKMRWGFIDYLDMNRVWPGDLEGNTTEIIAYSIFNNLILSADYLIDLHTAASDGENQPHVLVPPPEVFKKREGRDYAAKEDISLTMAKYFGLKFVRISKTNERRKYYAYLYGQLHVVAPSNGIPAITVELGEGGRLSMEKFKIGYRGVINVARYLGILYGEPEKFDEPIMLGEFKAIRAPIGGIAIINVSLGEFVKEGSTVAFVENISRSVEVKAPMSGYIMRIRKYPIVEPGERLVVLASKS